MKIFKFIITILLLKSTTASALVRPENCKPETTTDSFVYSDDFKWGYELLEMQLKFKEIYNSDKRLKKRAYINPTTKKIALPYYLENGGDVIINEKFVNNISMHIQEAFKYEYIDGVFFPDMGHSHLFIPQKLWEIKYSKYPVSETALFYQDVFNDPELKILYHTAEQLKTTINDEIINDRKLQWRFHTRNLVALNSELPDLKIIQAKDSPANTLRDLEGYFYYGGGFNLSANQNGCFETTVSGKPFRFDLSLFDLESQNPTSSY